MSVGLDAQAIPNVPPQTLPLIVWPMLHVDTGAPHIYEYLMVPGADLPVVVNGAVTIEDDRETRTHSGRLLRHGTMQ